MWTFMGFSALRLQKKNLSKLFVVSSGFLQLPLLAFRYIFKGLLSYERYHLDLSDYYGNLILLFWLPKNLLSSMKIYLDLSPRTQRFQMPRLQRHYSTIIIIIIY